MFQSVPNDFMMRAGAYFDESGTDTGAVAHCVAGYVIMEEPAKHLDSLWRAVLRKHGLTHFHMVDCAHGAGEFAGMRKDERSQIARSMIEIIKALVGIGFAVCFNPNRYRIDLRGPGIDHYSHAIWTVTVLARAYVTHHTAATSLSLAFERGHKDMSRAIEAVDEFLARPSDGVAVTGYQFVEKTSLPAVQAADLLAWQCLQYVRGKVEGRGLRKDMASLLEAPHSIYHLALGSGGVGIGINEDTAPSSENPRRDAAILGIYKTGDYVSVHNAEAWEKVKDWARSRGLTQ